MNVSDVSLQVRLQFERLLAKIALVRFSALMRHFVSFKVVKAFKALLTDLAFVWVSFFSVSPLVLIEGLHADELLIAFAAFELVFHLYFL